MSPQINKREETDLIQRAHTRARFNKVCVVFTSKAKLIFSCLNHANLTARFSVEMCAVAKNTNPTSVHVCYNSHWLISLPGTLVVSFLYLKAPSVLPLLLWKCSFGQSSTVLHDGIMAYIVFHVERLVCYATIT